VREIRRGGSNYYSKGCDCSPPKTFKMTQKLIENRRPNMHDMNEHAVELASLQRRLAEIGNVSHY